MWLQSTLVYKTVCVSAYLFVVLEMSLFNVSLSAENMLQVKTVRLL